MSVSIEFRCPICGCEQTTMLDTENNDDMEFNADCVPIELYEYLDDIIQCDDCSAELRASASDSFEAFDTQCVEVTFSHISC